jgi:RNA polymerase sigma factor (sigma-70 family)
MPRRLFFRLLAAAAPPGDHVPDAELLRRFASARDPAAFELLVRRHADAVWAAGLRVVGNRADAEDVFQTAFLVLARKAGAVRGPCAGGWLYRVAVNAALKLKASRERQRPEADLAPVARAPGSPDAAEVAAVVHEELARLPDRYRLPVVLCDLEGHTHAEAARALGWPVGSVSGRLSRAHALLRDRLARRGLAAPAVLFATATAPATAVPAASGANPASPLALSLAEGVLSAMRTAKLQFAAVLAAGGVVALAGLGTGYALTRPAAQPPGTPADPVAKKQPPPAKAENWTPPDGDPPGSPPSAFPDLLPPDRKVDDYVAELMKVCPRVMGPDAPEVQAGDDAARKLLKARLHQGRLEARRVMTAVQIGRFDNTFLGVYLDCLSDMRAAAAELWADDPKTLVPWLEEFVAMGKHFERFVRARVEAAIDPPQLLYTAARHRLAAELALWKAKSPPKR